MGSRRIESMGEKALLPHERDEVPDHAFLRRVKILQAESDLSRGMVDTDNYTRVRGWFDRLRKRSL